MNQSPQLKPQFKNFGHIIGWLGLGFFIFGWGYLALHALDFGPQSNIGYLAHLGYLMMIIGPFFTGKRYLSFILIGLAIIYLGWAYSIALEDNY